MPTSPSTPNASKRPARAAGVWRVGGTATTPAQLRVVVCRAGRAGEPSVVIESFRTIDAPTKAVITRNIKPLAEVMVGVLPAAAATWRRLETPVPAESNAESIAGALALMAEMQAPGVPAHRRAAGVLRVSPEAPPITGVAAWVQDMPAPVSSLDALGEITQYVPSTAALAIAMRVTGRALGVSVLAETGEGGVGTITVLASGPRGTVVRVARDESSDKDAWLASIRDRADEAASASGAAPLTITAEALVAGVAIAAPGGRSGEVLVGSIPSAPRWLEEYAPALGAAAGVILADPFERALVAMTFDPPGTAGGLIERGVTALARPRVAVALAVVCLALLLGLPLAAAYARLTLVTARAASTEPVRAPVLDAARQADLYAITVSRRWPMSKLLAEVVGIAPKGVSVESVTIEVGQPVRIVGTAESAEAVSQWREKLAGSPIFEDAKSNQSTISGQSGVRFDLSARVAQPTMAMNSDAAALAKAAQAAAGNANTAAPAAPRSGASTTTSNRPPARNDNPPARSDRGGSTPSRNNTPATASPTDPKPAPAPVPSPISADQITKLDRAGAMREFSERRRAASLPSIDETTRQRLKDEAEACRARLQSLSGSSS